LLVATDMDILTGTMDVLAHAALKPEGYCVRTVSIKVRYEDFETHTREKTMEHLKPDLNSVKRTARELLSEFTGTRKIRLPGRGSHEA